MRLNVPSVVAAAFSLLAACLHAQTSEHNAALPVTRVALYKNGVGFFEHTGTVTGDAEVTIDFTSAQLNDVLQSLTAIDLNGGRISGAGYNSTTPLEQQLKTLPLALNDNPTTADFYQAIRGARVEVHSGSVTATGRLLSMEIRNGNSDDQDSKSSSEHHYLTVVSDAGEVHSVELTPSTSVKLLDSALDTDVTRYLKLLDSTRSQGLRHLTLADHGTGSRQLLVSYISEVPVWKSTYRILFTDNSKSNQKQTATLQGWSVVDNTTGADWINVHLSLIAGAPQSFIQPLSQPIYSRRPEVGIAQEAQLTPQTFESGVGPAAPPKPLYADGYMGGQLPKAASRAGIAMGRPQGDQVVVDQNSSAIAIDGVALDALSDDPNSLNSQLTALGGYQAAAGASFAPGAKTEAFDDFFAYHLTEPVTIRKNESALVPILQTKIDADRVTLVHSNGNTLGQPLRALWITNTSGLTLDRGSFSIVDNGNFGGEGLLDPIHPNERRLLSYAADQAIHVTTENRYDTSRIDRITASKGVLTFQRAERSEVNYVVHNAAADARTVILEHPVQNGYTLDKGATPEETTGSVYRFRVDAPANDTAHLHIASSHRGVTVYQLTNSNDQQLTFYVQQSGDNPQLKTALAPILDARRHVADAQAAVDQTKVILDNLRASEDRQRSNITALDRKSVV